MNEKEQEGSKTMKEAEKVTKGQNRLEGSHTKCIYIHKQREVWSMVDQGTRIANYDENKNKNVLLCNLHTITHFTVTQHGKNVILI